ncbi:MAG: sigma-70 family RNA polymerase sigma factor [Candidatus Eisenbacteria bacterium]|nr:sigma-70 family RNA polymerase sigma factor [Candidatus Eisenbacteria bacterium]
MSDAERSERQAEEAAWVAQTLAGDDRAFAALVRRYQGPLLRLLRAMLRQGQDAEDLLQETFLRAYRFLHRFDPERPFGPWLMRIGANLARNELRRRRTRREVPLDEAPGGEEDGYAGAWLADARPLAEIDHRRLLDATRGALSELPEDQRVVLEMRILGEMSYGEIAATLEIPIGTVMSRLSRGRRKIQEVLRAFHEARERP